MSRRGVGSVRISVRVLPNFGRFVPLAVDRVCPLAVRTGVGRRPVGPDDLYSGATATQTEVFGLVPVGSSLQALITDDLALALRNRHVVSSVSYLINSPQFHCE